MSDESEQNARAELKKRYFDFTSHLEDKDATVQLYQKNTVFVSNFDTSNELILLFISRW